MVSATPFVFNYDLIRRRAAYGNRPAGNQPEHIGPLRTFTNYQISDHQLDPLRQDLGFCPR